MKVKIVVDGCDDETSVTLDVTKEERYFVDKLATLITMTSDSGCQPRMTVTDEE